MGIAEALHELRSLISSRFEYWAKGDSPFRITVSLPYRANDSFVVAPRLDCYKILNYEHGAEGLEAGSKPLARCA